MDYAAVPFELKMCTPRPERLRPVCPRSRDGRDVKSVPIFSSMKGAWDSRRVPGVLLRAAKLAPSKEARTRPRKKTPPSYATAPSFCGHGIRLARIFDIGGSAAGAYMPLQDHQQGADQKQQQEAERRPFSRFRKSVGWTLQRDNEGGN